MKQKIWTASLLLLMVLGTGLVLMACGSKSLADSRTAGSDSYGLNVESIATKPATPHIATGNIKSGADVDFIIFLTESGD